MVIVPYVPELLELQTIEALRPYNTWYEDVSGSDTAYADLLVKLWDERHTFVIVEHDIVPFPGAIDELLACSEEWCAFAYDYPPFGTYAGLGCCKFSASLLSSKPMLAITARRTTPYEHTPGHWCTIDAILQAHLSNAGVLMHLHDGSVNNVKNYHWDRECPHKKQLWQNLRLY